MSVANTLTNALSTVSPGSVAYNNIQTALSNINNDMHLKQINTASQLEYDRQSYEAQVSRDWQESMSAAQMEYNSKEAQKNRDWQEYMSNTAHQREVKDLMAAGLNPVLSASGGNGAAVTSGSAASAALPSGATASGTTGLTSAIVSLLGTLMNTTTQLANANTNAVTNLTVADKYTEMAKLTAMIGADASKYSANKSYAASKYSADMQEYIAEKYPNTFPAALIRAIEDVLDGDINFQPDWDKVTADIMSDYEKHKQQKEKEKQEKEKERQKKSYDPLLR